VSYGSSSQFNSAAFKLAEYILKKKPHLKVIMHRDRDYLNNKEIEDILKKLKEKDISPSYLRE
jgi:5,10-methylenetetrahydrofolate reductase